MNNDQWYNISLSVFKYDRESVQVFALCVSTNNTDILVVICLHVCVWLVIFFSRRFAWTMWRKAALVALLAFALGYIYHTNPTVQERALQLITQSIPQSLFSSQHEHSTTNLEETISRAWDALITPPARQWGRIAVGWVTHIYVHIVHMDRWAGLDFYLS